MKILIVPNNTDNNCFRLRNFLPAKFLEKLGHTVKIQNEFKGYYHPGLKQTVVDPKPIDWADVIVFNRHYDIDSATIRNLMLFAKANRKLVIYETDDLLEGLDMTNPMYQAIQKNVAQVRMMTMLADKCTTTGIPLKAELLKYNSRVNILPNCVDPTEWKERKGGNKKVRVGWAGGSSHLADMLLVTGAVAELQKELDFEFVIFGLAPMQWKEYMAYNAKRHEEEKKAKNIEQVAPWYKKTLELDQELAKINWIHEPFIPLNEYSQKLSDLNFDIGICPLEDTRFNRCKSAIKFYEYAMVGTCTLASKVTPYKEEVSYLAKNNIIDWKNKLKELILDSEKRTKLAKEQRAWVLENRDINNNIKLWEDAYRNLSNNWNR